MRAGMVAVALAVVVANAAVVEAAAQTAQDTAQRAQTAATPAAGDLQAYALQLQDTERRLARAKEAAGRAGSESQEGAMSPARQGLMQATRDAWRNMQNVPPAFADTDAYKQAERRMRQDFGTIGATRTLSHEEGMQAAEDALRALAQLREQVAAAATQAGASTPSPAVSGGGGGTR